MLKVKSLHIYPVKSARGIDLSTANVHPRGLAGDRRFMLVRKDGKFITQRDKPQLAQLSLQTSDNGIVLKWPNSQAHHVNFPKANKRMDVVVWRSTVNAAFIDNDVNATLSEWLGMQVALVFMDEGAVRQASAEWTTEPSEVSFADGYPILITTMESLGAVNTHIIGADGCPLPMTRFRPNIVIEGAQQAWAESDWKQIQIGEVILDIVKPCARCIMTSIDQDSGEKGVKSALGALKHLNPSNDPNNPGVIFGMNCVVRKVGAVNVGDVVSAEM